MKILVIGLGSMGKRRIRNLQSIGNIEIDGFDVRTDRAEEVHEKHGILTFTELPDLTQYQAIIISTHPKYHFNYIKQSLDLGISCFIEISLILAQLPELLQHPNFKRVIVAPSCTLRFHPAIKQITKLVQSGEFGRITNFSYHSGQYLPDWHPWEPMTAFFAGQKDTGACREILSFELTWLISVFGWPEQVFGYCLKTGILESEIDDVYAITAKYAKFAGTLMIDATARYATRSLILNLEQAQIRWSWETQKVWVYDAVNQREIVYHNPQGKAQAGYNVNIVEEMYVEELHTFIKAVKGETTFPNSLADDIRVLELLHEVEAGA
jgi:predicted dehydrogenase